MTDNTLGLITEPSKEDLYHGDMHEYLMNRGEIKFTDKGYVDDIVSKDTIRSAQGPLLKQYGFRIKQYTRYDEHINEFARTEIIHRGGHTEFLERRVIKWVQYPDGHLKQFNYSMDNQAAITYIHGKQLLELLEIYEGYNPEEEYLKSGVTAGNIKLIDAEKAANVAALLSGNPVLTGKIKRAYKIDKPSQIQEKDYKSVMDMISENLGDE